MRFFLKSIPFCVFLLTFLTYFPAWAQLDNAALLEGQVPKYDSNSLSLSLANLGYLRNNEYFNDIVSGETFFGYQLTPKLVYQASPALRLELGAFLQKDFGNADFQEVEPFYRLSYQKKGFTLILGNLLATLEHGLLEPLLAFEQRLRRPLETGIQLRYRGERFQGELWVDWQQAVSRDRSRPEIIQGGWVSDWQFIKTKQFSWSLPLQFTIQHVGGQDLSIDLNGGNQSNAALGTALEWKIPSSPFWHSVRWDIYGLIYLDDFSDTTQRREGTGVYSNLYIKNKIVDLLLSYWRGEEFSAPQGGDLYRSFPVKADGQLEEVRQLLFIRLLKDFQVREDFSISLRVEPYLDLENQLGEFSFGVYLHYRPRFKLYQKK